MSKDMTVKRANMATDLHYDPVRRLLAAVVLQAVRDAHFPEQAREFLADDEEVRPVVEWLGLPWTKVQNGEINMIW
jgi:hypothetical protein